MQVSRPILGPMTRPGSQCARRAVCAAMPRDHSISGCDRRQLMAGLLTIPLVGTVQPAQAGPVGDTIASLWKGRQQANAGKIIAPIKVAQQRLATAMSLMESASSSPSALTPVLQAVRTSSLNCYVFEALADDSLETKASLASQQFQISDPCTFRLIVKNITTLSSSEERSKGEELVASIILSYQKLDGELEGAIQGGNSLAAARDQLRATMEKVEQLELYVSNVLAV